VHINCKNYELPCQMHCFSVKDYLLKAWVTNRRGSVLDHYPSM